MGREFVKMPSHLFAEHITQFSLTDKGLGIDHDVTTDVRLHYYCERSLSQVISQAMITVEAISEVAQDGTLKIELPKSVTPGPHRVVVVVEEAPLELARPRPAGPLHLTKLHLEAWPNDSTFRREDIYGDGGR